MDAIFGFCLVIEVLSSKWFDKRWQMCFSRPSQEIIQQLIDNSTTFKDKTEYAQDKYIKKKKKKWVFHSLPPTKK